MWGAVDQSMDNGQLSMDNEKLGAKPLLSIAHCTLLIVEFLGCAWQAVRWGWAFRGKECDDG